MTTVRKSQVNLRNAGCSTGPRSAEGKEVSAMNARVHGLQACEGLLPWESAEDYAVVKARLREELAPVGVLEEMLVSCIARNHWRLEKRLPQFEVGVICQSMVNAIRDEAFIAKFDKGTPLPVHKESVMDVGMLMASDTTTLGGALINDMSSAAVFDHLDRYRRSLERSIAEEMERLRHYQQQRCMNVS